MVSMTGEPLIDSVDATSGSSRFRVRVIVVVSFTCLVALCYAMVLRTYGSVSVALRVLKGESLLMTSTRIDAGRLSTSVPVRVEAEVRNHKTRPVRLLGVTLKCTCVIVEGLPQVIQPNQKVSIPIQVHALETKPKIDEIIMIFTDDPACPILSFRVSGLAVH